jgi:hypothetical protein
MGNKKTTYSAVRNTIQTKMNCYRTLWNQTTGSSSSYRPTPAQINSLTKWVEKGARIQNVTYTQLNRWAGTPQRNWTVGAAKSTLTNKFGKSCIKAVAWNKSGGFIVATTPTRQGKSFKIS